MSATSTGALEKNEEMVKGDYMDSDGEQEATGNEESRLTCACAMATSGMQSDKDAENVMDTAC